VVPYLPKVVIDREDSMALEAQAQIRPTEDHKINIAVIRLPHISNFTDLEVLEREPETILNWLYSPIELFAYDLLILPGSKNSLYDLLWLQSSGWAEKVRKFAEAGKWVIGLCGGFQILGREITDPGSLEGSLKQAEGLGLLDVSTEIQPIKILRRTEGRDRLFGERVIGYEIHMGESHLFGHTQPFLTIAEEGRFDGAMSERGNIIGTYLHGLFDAGCFRRHLLNQIAIEKGIPFELSAGQGNFWEEKDKQYELVAAHFLRYTDINHITRIMEEHSW
jgi:adenosylcobyric acid synthase